MAHFRERHILEKLRKLLKFSPLVGILGHRQVGKTTILEAECNEYVTFDNDEILKEAEATPQAFINKFKKITTGIDESQYVPKIFPALKERVRKNKTPGQFILSGSVRFTSRKAIRESLTGRIMNLELLPLTLTEIKKLKCSKSLLDLLKSGNWDHSLTHLILQISQNKIILKQIPIYLERGGLPGVCFIRDAGLRKNKIIEQLNTILDRDLRLVYATTLPFNQILEFVRELAEIEGNIVRYSVIEKKIGMSEETQKKILYALESIFVLRIFSIEGSRKGQIVIFEDQAEAAYLSRGKLPIHKQLNHLVYRQLRAQFFYETGIDYRFFHFKTRGGACVPIAIETNIGILGIICLVDISPSASDLASAASFLKHYNNSRIIYFSQDKQIKLLSDRELIVSMAIL
jgi:predicted AAA+ superfamily ATPase